MLKRYLLKGFLALGLSVVVFSVLGVKTQYSYAINNGFGDTSWVGNSKGQDIKVYGTDKGDEGETPRLIDTIKKFINWTLGILSLLTLLILLWGGFQMLLAAGDEGKFKKGFTILKQAAVALAFIGLAWLMVTFIFWLIKGVTGTT